MNYTDCETPRVASIMQTSLTDTGTFQGCRKFLHNEILKFAITSITEQIYDFYIIRKFTCLKQAH